MDEWMNGWWCGVRGGVVVDGLYFVCRSGPSKAMGRPEKDREIVTKRCYSSACRDVGIRNIVKERMAL